MQNTEFKTGVIRPVEVYKEAWERIKDQYWLIFAITLVGLLIGSAVPIVLVGPMICGIYMCLFQKLDRGLVNFELLFKGFDHFVPSLIVAVVATLPVFVLMFTIYIPMIAMAIAGDTMRMREEELLPFIIGTFAVAMVEALLMVCLHTLLMFSFPLIADRRLGGIEAMKVSARAVWRNLGGVAGLFGVGILVAIGGYLMLCVGVYLTLPLIFAANAVAYRKIFPSMDQQNFGPPPPNAYSGL